MNSLIKTRLEARLTTLDEQIAAAEAGVLDMIAGGISVFELDTGEADQKVIFKNPNTFQKFIDALYAQREWVIRRLTGTSITSVKARRK